MARINFLQNIYTMGRCVVYFPIIQTKNKTKPKKKKKLMPALKNPNIHGENVKAKKSANVIASFIMI